MKIEDRAELAAQANECARSSRYGADAPTLCETSVAETVAQWLQWCDRNGSHTADLAESEGCDPYDDETAWDALRDMLNDAS